MEHIPDNTPAISRYPYLLSWSFAVLTILAGIIKINQNFAVQLHDTYYATTVFQVCLGLAIYTTIMGVVYYLLRRIPFLSFLTILHLVLSFFIFGLLILYVLPSSGTSLFKGWTSNYLQVNQITFYLVLGFLGAQVLWLFNIIVGSIKYFKQFSS